MLSKTGARRAALRCFI